MDREGNIDRIIAEVARTFGVGCDALKGPCRSGDQNVAAARQMLFYVCKRGSSMTVTDIAHALECSTAAVVDGLLTAQRLVDIDCTFRDKLRHIEQSCCSLAS